MGDPSDPASKMGALVSREHLAKVRGYVELARQEGCSLLTGDEPLELPERNRNVSKQRLQQHCMLVVVVCTCTCTYVCLRV